MSGTKQLPCLDAGCTFVVLQKQEQEHLLSTENTLPGAGHKNPKVATSDNGSPFAGNEIQGRPSYQDIFVVLIK